MVQKTNSEISEMEYLGWHARTSSLAQEGVGNAQYESPASQAKLQIGIIDPFKFQNSNTMKKLNTEQTMGQSLNPSSPAHAMHSVFAFSASVI